MSVRITSGWAGGFLPVSEYSCNLQGFGINFIIFFDGRMLVKEKLQVLHLWSNEEEVKRVISELTGTGVEFEATLVKSESEYVTSLARKDFDIIIADERAVFTYRTLISFQLSKLPGK